MMTVSMNTRPIIIEVRIWPAASGCSAMLLVAFVMECAMPIAPPKHATAMRPADAHALRILTAFSLELSSVSTPVSSGAVSLAAIAGTLSAHTNISNVTSDQIFFIVSLLNAKW